MAGRAAASPPAGAGPPPSPCPAVCGLRSSSSPCLRGPEPGEPRAGRRRRGGPRCRLLAPTRGAGRLSGSACPLRAPASARERGMLPGAAGTGGGCSRGSRADPSAPAQLDPSLQLQVPAPPPPAANGGPPPAPPLLPIGCRGCPSRRHSWTGRTVPGGDGRGAPAGVGPGHPLPWGEIRGENGDLQRRGRGGGGKPRAALGGGSPRWDTAAPGEGEAGETQGRRDGAGDEEMGRKKPQASEARQGQGAEGSRSRYRALPCAAQTLPKTLSLLPPAPSPTARERRPCCWARRMWVTSPCHPTPSPLRGATPSGAGRPYAAWGHDPGQQLAGGPGPEQARGTRHPQPREQRVPPVPPARRTRPELPLPVRVPAAAGAVPDGGDRAASIPGEGRDARPEQGARHAEPETFLQRDQSNRFSAGDPHFECRRPQAEPEPCF
ncbi:basic proline-rich protein-like [Pipra filicauda]|uniref:Basic proline-rich protein-like n=1 Tax=Pipra filicauda TaxID=649802 RepID=A0A6J2IZT0_9PASS|nr:basic proline-rich protein-like [Pipra filicauda]